ncbi:MAG: transglycosylase domain-containing protein [Actinomycetota bacterium]
MSPPQPGYTQWLPPEAPTQWQPRPAGQWDRNPHGYGRDDGDGRSWLAKIALAAVVAGVLVPVVVVLILYSTYKGLLAGSLPDERPSVVSGITRVYDEGGRQIALLREFDLSLPVSQQDIPQVLKDAVVAAEDRRFYSHNGVDDRAILRAIWADITGGGYIEGASTITQQYVRMLYLTPDKTLDRKLREAALARRVEKEMTKDEILYRYLDRVYLGGGAYGVGAASQSYFRKPVNDLTISEAALLAGLIQLPSVNDPRSNPAGAEQVRVRVLGQMLDQGRINQAQHDEAVAERLFLRDVNFEPSGPATVVHPHLDQQSEHPYFVDYVRRYLVARYGDEKVYRGGLQVYTSINPELQAMAEAAVNEALRGTTAPLEMSLVSVEPSTGLVRALIGGRDFSRSEVNLALGNCPNPTPPRDGEPFCVPGGGTGRQPGSAFKPITLARALEEGISVDKVYSGPSTYRFPNCTGGAQAGCTVSNVESAGYGSLTLSQATALSVNTVYAQLVQDVGVKDTAEAAHRLGLTMISPDGVQPNGQAYGPSLTLGAAEVSPLDMASAYGTFANRGSLVAPSPVVRVEEPDGTVLEDVKNRKGRQVLAQPLADQVNQVLARTISAGTGTGADIGRPNGTAGKTGTSEDFGDAWFVGYTPQLSTAIWMGYSDSRRPLTNVKGLARVYGGTLPAPTWKAYMTEAAPLLNLTDFVQPAPPPTTAPPPAPLFESPAPAPPTTGPSPTTTAPRTPVAPPLTRPPVTQPRRPPPTFSFPIPTTVPPTVPTTVPPTTPTTSAGPP